MEITTCQSLSHAPNPIFPAAKPPISSALTSSLLLKCSDSKNSYSKRLQGAKLEFRARHHHYHQKAVGPVYAASSEAQGPSTDAAASDRWLLVPVGDGDSRHLGYKVQMPDAFEIASNEVTVGRVPEQADVVIPVATVSGLHARIQKKAGSLYVTDLDSTNGTFIGEKRLKPGVEAEVPAGSCVVFGDIHLAMFQVSKLQNVVTPSEREPETAETDAKTETDSSSAGNESAS